MAREISGLVRFERKGFKHPVEHLSYADAGNSLGWPHVSAMSTQFKHPVSGEDLTWYGEGMV